MSDRIKELEEFVNNMMDMNNAREERYGSRIDELLKESRASSDLMRRIQALNDRLTSIDQRINALEAEGKPASFTTPGKEYSRTRVGD
jgi:hypothetical protein